MADTRKIRFSTIAYAIDATPKSLRNWLVRGQLGLAGAPVEGKWMELDLVDVAMLAVTRKLVDFGMKVDEASRQAREAVLDPLFKRPFEQAQANRNPDENTINEVLRGLRYVTFPDPNYAFGWQTQTQRAAELRLPASAVIVIALDEVVATALRRVREHLEGKIDSDRPGEGG